jgi:hypothetical protein
VSGSDKISGEHVEAGVHARPQFQDVDVRGYMFRFAVLLMAES